MDVRDAIVSAGKELGYARLKDKQMKAVTTFMQGKDVFVSLQTGYGKSIIYAVLPLLFDRLRGKQFLNGPLYNNNVINPCSGTSGSIVLCISPLTAIMMEQVSKFRSSGLTTEFVGSAQTSSSVW